MQSERTNRNTLVSEYGGRPPQRLAGRMLIIARLPKRLVIHFRRDLSQALRNLVGLRSGCRIRREQNFGANPRFPIEFYTGQLTDFRQSLLDRRQNGSYPKPAWRINGDLLE